MARRVLFVCNDPSAPAALLGDVFAESGFDISTFEVVPAGSVDDPAVDVTFPDPVHFDAIVPLGSRWAAHDDRLPWVRREMEMLRAGLDAGAGVLGVCFGGQLLARALGGTVARSDAPEIGWCEVSSERPALVPPGPWFQWHFDRFTVPPGATSVARNDAATQAFVLGRALGLQFHPEVDSDLVERWVAEDADADLARLGLHADALRAATAALTDDASRRLRLLVRGFVGLLEQGAQHGAHGRG